MRDIAPRGPTENVTQDLRSYRVELFLFTLLAYLYKGSTTL